MYKTKKIKTKLLSTRLENKNQVSLKFYSIENLYFHGLLINIVCIIYVQTYTVYVHVKTYY